MPANRNALIRYRTIDACLRNRQRRWTLQDLMDACSEALYEYEGIEKGVSRRTVQNDIQLMRSEKLGYEAPIVVIEKKYYTYSDPDYSITNLPLTDTDLDKLGEVVEILRQFKGFAHFQELSGMVQRLEDKVYTSRTRQPAIIDLEKNENLQGLQHLEPLYQAILNQNTISVTYQSFKAPEPSTFLYYPYLLKEYNNRWFVLGNSPEREGLITLALDRLQAMEAMSLEPFVPYEGTPLSEYFEHNLGVTVFTEAPIEEVRIRVVANQAPYIKTKPIHASQIILNETDTWVEFGYRLRLNYELEKTLLGFGEYITVLAPDHLRERMAHRIVQAAGGYQIQPNSDG